MATLAKHRNITGPARDKLAGELAKKYAKGATLRTLAQDIGRSYGFVHRLLEQRGVRMRPRGGNTRGAKR